MFSLKSKPKEQNTYRTPLIRLVYSLFRFGGLQIQAINDGTLGSVINFLWNLCIDVLIIYTLTHLHFERPYIEAACFSNNRKLSPLLLLFVSYTFTLTRPICFTINVLHYFFVGRKMMALLDSPLFTEIYSSPQKAKVIVITIAATTHFSFIGLWYINGNSIISLSMKFMKTSWLELSLYFFAQYIMSMYQFWVCLILHYYQHGTAVILQQITQQLSNLKNKQKSKTDKQLKWAFQIEEKCLERIIALAKLNARINSQLSVMLLSYILMNGSQVMMAICFLLVCTPSFSMLANSLFLWVYLLFLAVINEQNRRAARNVFTIMRKRYQQSDEEDEQEVLQKHPFWVKRTANRLRQWTPRWWSDTNYGDSSLRKIAESELKTVVGGRRVQQRALRLQQADLYQSYFTIKMFHFAWLGLPFIFQVALFITNNVVLMTQTQ